MKYVLTILCVLAGLIVIAPVPSVSAHQDGCHRWHSCPSDSGSYVCGDLGYYSECGTSYYEAPDYYAQGEEDGQDFVSDNSAYIAESGSSEGETDGSEDGSIGDFNSPSPDSDATCSEINYSDTSLPSEYYEGFEDTYSVGCAESYDEAYDSAYTSAYDLAYAEYEKSSELGAEELASSDESDSSGTWLILGFLALGGGFYAYDAFKSRSKRN